MENLKELTKDEKIEKLKSYMNGECLDDILAFNVFLLICPAKNFKEDFFAHEKVMYSSLIEYVSIIGSLKAKMIEFCGNLLGIYEACFKHCIPVKIENQETLVPEQYIKIFSMLDLQRIAKLYENYEPIKDENKYTDAYKVLYPIMKQFVYYIDIINEGGFGDGSGNTK